MSDVHYRDQLDTLGFTEDESHYLLTSMKPEVTPILDNLREQELEWNYKGFLKDADGNVYSMKELYSDAAGGLALYLPKETPEEISEEHIKAMKAKWERLTKETPKESYEYSPLTILLLTHIHKTKKAAYTAANMKAAQFHRVHDEALKGMPNFVKQWQIHKLSESGATPEAITHLVYADVDDGVPTVDAKGEPIDPEVIQRGKDRVLRNRLNRVTTSLQRPRAYHPIELLVIELWMKGEISTKTLHKKQVVKKKPKGADSDAEGLPKGITAEMVAEWDREFDEQEAKAKAADTPNSDTPNSDSATPVEPQGDTEEPQGDAQGDAEDLPWETPEATLEEPPEEPKGTLGVTELCPPPYQLYDTNKELKPEVSQAVNGALMLSRMVLGATLSDTKVNQMSIEWCKDVGYDLDVEHPSLRALFTYCDHLVTQLNNPMLTLNVPEEVHRGLMLTKAKL